MCSLGLQRQVKSAGFSFKKTTHLRFALRSFPFLVVLSAGYTLESPGYFRICVKCCPLPHPPSEVDSIGLGGDR